MRATIVSLAALGLLAGTAQAAETINIAYIDPLSGPGANVGEIGLKTLQWMIEQLNAAGGANGKKFEVSALDNKTNPQETVVQAQKAVDKGAHFLTQGNGSSVAAALSEYTIKNNERNPSKQVLYLNYATVDPNLTNEKCNF